MTCSHIRSVAVIGSGIAGLTVGNLAREAGVNAVLFEKARGPGGRISSKRLSGGSVDLGAQYFTVRNPHFRDFLERYAQDVVQPWQGRLLHEGESGELAPFPKEDRWVGVPRMSALSRALSEPLTLETTTPVRRAWQVEEQWYLESDKGRHGPYDALVVAVPPAQARALLPAVPGVEQTLAGFEMAPCWAVAARFEDSPAPGFEGVSLRNPVLDWAACNASKPGRSDDTDRHGWWVLHATPSWSRMYSELAPDEVARQLVATFRERFGLQAEPMEWIAHCWRYARPEEAADAPGMLSMDARKLGFCGDWLAGGRVEGAFNSGFSLIRHWRDQGLLPEADPAADRSE